MASQRCSRPDASSTIFPRPPTRLWVACSRSSTRTRPLRTLGASARPRLARLSSPRPSPSFLPLRHYRHSIFQSASVHLYPLLRVCTLPSLLLFSFVLPRSLSRCFRALISVLIIYLGRRLRCGVRTASSLPSRRSSRPRCSRQHPTSACSPAIATLAWYTSISCTPRSA